MCKNLKNMESEGTEFLEMVLEVRKAELKAILNIYLLKQKKFFRIYLSSNKTITFQRGKVELALQFRFGPWMDK